ncbi:MAG: hypothetical protein IPJ77_11445 [Planctomycetes bacterium]|nr:hypothetical protein [Planctomycetota bacterium]
MSIEWKFRRRDGRCGGCEAEFPESARHASVLAVVGDEVRREDLCVSCWERRAHDTDLFYWFTRRSKAKSGLVLDLVTLEQLFLQLEGRGERAVRELRYLVALLLMRKRRIKLDRVTRGPDGEAMIVRRPRRKEAFTVFVFDFTAERMNELRQKLVGLFDGAEPSAWLQPQAGEAPLAEAEAGTPGAVEAGPAADLATNVA